MWTLLFVLTLSAVFASALFHGPIPGSILQRMATESEQPTPDDLNVDQYLRTYGYMDDTTMDNVGEDDDVEVYDDERFMDYAKRRTDALKLFQKFAGLKVTGEEDEETRQQMLRPRCGIEDIEVGRPENARWNKTVITYKFKSFTKDISENDVKNAFIDALNQWSVASKLKFEEIKQGRPIMDIRFVNRKHLPCRYDMDGRGGRIAHAYYPQRHPFGGDMHFDDAENYKYKQGQGIDIVSVILHEAGHALGLRHGYTRGSIMVPWYTGQTTLGPNDIKRIKSLYA